MMLRAGLDTSMTATGLSREPSPWLVPTCTDAGPSIVSYDLGDQPQIAPQSHPSLPCAGINPRSAQGQHSIRTRTLRQMKSRSRSGHRATQQKDGQMQQNIFAYTSNEVSFPEYISINERDGEIEVTVRSPANGDEEGATANMTLPREEAMKLRKALRLYLQPVTDNA